MNEKYNELPNLDPTIELDGTEYNLTAVDALWADVARRVEKSLDITLSEHMEPNNNAKVIYDGDDTKSISIVPSTGGVFTGPVVIPDPPTDSENDPDKDKYAINLKNVYLLIQKLKGFPTYIWDGSELAGQEPDVNSDSLSPFKVVLYYNQTPSNPTENNPKAIRFSDDNGYIECYFFAINLYNGYLSLGHCFKDKDTEYISLGVNRSEYTSIIADLKDDGTVKNEGEYNRQYNYEDIRNLDQTVYGYYEGDYTSVRYENGLDDMVRALIKTIYGDDEPASNTNYTPGTNGLVKAVSDLQTNSNSHINNGLIHRQIFYGTEDVGQYTFSPAASIGDIYIKYEQ